MATDVLPDEKPLRYGRRARAFTAMEEHDLDVLVLGRGANVRYVCGARGLWNAGTHGFAPVCAVVRSTRQVYLLSTWDEGIPEEIPHEHMLGITWNPMNYLTWLRDIEGSATAGRVGFDSISPLFAQLLPAAFPAAEIVDGEDAIQAARLVKTPEEVVAIRGSLSIVEQALASALSDLRPGVEERALTGVFMEAMASLGVTTPSTQDVVTITSSRDRTAPKGQEAVRAGDLVAFTAGVLDGGYAGEVARTWPVGGGDEIAKYRDAFDEWDELWSHLIQACRPGASGGDFFAAYRAANVAVPSLPIVRGVGLGYDLPIVVADLPATAAGQRVASGMTLAVTGIVDSPHGRVIAQEVVLVTDGEPEILTTSPFWTHQFQGAKRQ